MRTIAKLCLCLTDDEHNALQEVRQRLGRSGVLMNQSEVVRTAIIQFQQLGDEQLLAAAQRSPRLKPGRRKAR